MKKLTLTDLLVSLMTATGFVFFFLSGSAASILGLAAGFLGVLYFVSFRRHVIPKHIFIAADDRHERKENSQYLIGLILIMVLSATLLSYRLGEQDFHGDEFQVINAATGYLHTGNYYLWDFTRQDARCLDDTRQCRYIRAWPHTFLIAQSYKMFGISEWSSRLISLFFGVLLVALSYFFTKYFTGDRRMALITAFLFSISPYFIQLGRFTRMYALLAPLFLILAYLFFRGIVDKSDLGFIPWSRFRYFVERNLNFGYGYLLVAFLLLRFVYEIHINVLVIGPALLLFVFMMAVFSGERRYKVASLVGALGTATLFIANHFVSFLSFTDLLSFFQRTNLVYGEFLTRYPLPQKLGVIILLLGMFSLAFMSDKKLRTKLLYLYSIVTFSFVFFALVADRYSSPNYISHVIPLSVILITYFSWHFAYRFRSRFMRWTLVSVLPISAVVSLTSSWTALYGHADNYGDFSVAYRTIVEKYDPENDVIISPVPRHYYLQGMSSVPTVVTIPKNSGLAFEAFIEEVGRHESGWITWETKERNDLRNSVKQYIDDHFRKLSGQGVDDTGVEIYYFNRSMMPQGAASE